MAIDPGFGLLLAALSAPSASAPALHEEAPSKAPIELAFPTLSSGGEVFTGKQAVPHRIWSTPALAQPDERLQFRWTPAPAALFKIDPAGVRFNFQF